MVHRMIETRPKLTNIIEYLKIIWGQQHVGQNNGNPCRLKHIHLETQICAQLDPKNTSTHSHIPFFGKANSGQSILGDIKIETDSVFFKKNK